MRYVPRSPWFRAALVFPSVVAVVALLWWRGPDWGLVARAFNLVDWAWIVFAIGLNLAVGAGAVARLAADDRPGARPATAAFRPGLLRLLDRAAGERGAARPDRGARARRRPAAPSSSRSRDDRHARRHGLRPPALRPLSGAPARGIRLLDGEDPALGGDESGHRAGARDHALHARLRDRAAGHRHRASTSAGHCADCSSWPGRPGGARSPLPAAGRSCSKPRLGPAAVRGLCVDARLQHPRAASGGGARAAADERRDDLPLWPGNFGLLQAAVALPLVQYGVAYSTGFAYAIVLQFVEMSVGVGVGLIFLAREGLSFAMLRHMPDASEFEAADEKRSEPRRRRPVRALACPASLKGVLSAATAAAALAAGLRESGAQAEELPVADGGEGTAEALWLALGGDWLESEVHDAFGRPRNARLASSPGRVGRRRGCGRRSSRSASARTARSLQPRLRRARRCRARRGADGSGARARRNRNDGCGARASWRSSRIFACRPASPVT